MARAKASQYGVDVFLLIAMMEVESNYNPDAVSKCGAKGLMQLMPMTAEEVGVVNIFDPEENLAGAAKYINLIIGWINRYSRIMNLEIPVNNETILAAYNAGIGRFITAFANHGDLWKEFIPEETKSYIRKVIGLYEELNASSKSK